MELGPLITLHRGRQFAFLAHGARFEDAIGVNVAGNLMSFFDALSVTTRTAVYGTVGMDMEFN